MLFYCIFTCDILFLKKLIFKTHNSRIELSNKNGKKTILFKTKYLVSSRFSRLNVNNCDKENILFLEKKGLKTSQVNILKFTSLIVF